MPQEDRSQDSKGLSFDLPRERRSCTDFLQLPTLLSGYWEELELRPIGPTRF